MTADIYLFYGFFFIIELRKKEKTEQRGSEIRL